MKRNVVLLVTTAIIILIAAGSMKPLATDMWKVVRWREVIAQHPTGMAMILIKDHHDYDLGRTYGIPAYWRDVIRVEDGKASSLELNDGNGLRPRSTFDIPGTMFYFDYNGDFLGSYRVTDSSGDEIHIEPWWESLTPDELVISHGKVGKCTVYGEEGSKANYFMNWKLQVTEIWGDWKMLNCHL